MKAIVNAAVCPLKAEPKWESTLADEVLYGMVVDILEEAAPGWVRGAHALPLRGLTRP